MCHCRSAVTLGFRPTCCCAFQRQQFLAVPYLSNYDFKELSGGRWEVILYMRTDTDEYSLAEEIALEEKLVLSASN